MLGCLSVGMTDACNNQTAALSRGEPSDAAENFNTYRNLKQRRAYFTAMAFISKNKKNHGKVTVFNASKKTSIVIY